MENMLLTSDDLYSKPESELLANDSRQQIVAILYLVGKTLAGIFFIQWFRRAYFNVGVFRGKTQFTDGWASGAWFVPILNLWRPFQIMKELWTETVSYHRGQGKNNPEQEKGANLLGLCWTLWVIFSILDRVIYQMTKDTNDVDEFITLDIMALVSGALEIITGVIQATGSDLYVGGLPSGTYFLQIVEEGARTIKEFIKL